MDHINRIISEWKTFFDLGFHEGCVPIEAASLKALMEACQTAVKDRECLVRKDKQLRDLKRELDQKMSELNGITDSRTKWVEKAERACEEVNRLREFLDSLEQTVVYDPTEARSRVYEEKHESRKRLDTRLAREDGSGAAQSEADEEHIDTLVRRIKEAEDDRDFLVRSIRDLICNYSYHHDGVNLGDHECHEHEHGPDTCTCGLNDLVHRIYTSPIFTGEKRCEQ